MALPRLLTNALGVAAQQVGGAYDYLTPGGGSSTITNAGNAIVDPNQVYTGGTNIFTANSGIHDGGTSGFTQVSPTSSTSTYSPNNFTEPTQDGSVLGATGSYGGYSAPAPDYQSASQANDLISQATNLLGRLSSQSNIGQQNISDTFGNYRTGLMNGYGRNEADYSQNRTSSIRDNEIAKNNIDRRVATRANSLQRQIGATGGANSEAGLMLAPYAAARTGTQLRNDVNNKYASNMSSLDQSFGRYKDDFNNNLTSLEDQKTQQSRQLQANILQQQAGAQDNLSRGQSMLQYANTGNTASAQAIRDQAMPSLYALLQQIDELSRQQVTPTIKDATYSAPTLQNYATDNVQDVQGVDPVLQDSISPMYQYLLKRDEENLGY